MWIANRDTSGLSGQTTQVGHMLDLRERTQSLSAIAGYFAFYGVGDNLLSGSGEPERLSGVPVSDNFFDVLGVKPQLGRVFNAEECKWNGPEGRAARPRALAAAVRLESLDRRHLPDPQRRAPSRSWACCRRRSTSRRCSRRAATSTSTSRSRSARRRIAGATRWR